MTSSTTRHPSLLLIAITTVILTASLTITDAQKLPSSHERFKLASEALSQANSDTFGKYEDILMIQSGLMQLSVPQLQKAILQSIQELSDGGVAAGEGRSFQESLAAGESAGEAVQNTTSELCLNHTAEVIVELLARSGWAMQMLDAMGKPSPGITEGNIMWPGGYKQCLKVRANTSVPLHPHFSGQYCTLRVLLGGVAGGASAIPVQLGIGICAPDSCSSMDLTVLINSVLASFNATQQLLKTASVYADCVEVKSSLDTKAIVAVVICSIFLFFIVVGTAIDILLVQLPKWRMEDKTHSSTNGYSDGYGDQGERLPLLVNPDAVVKTPKIGISTKIFLAFSVYTNGSKLLSTKQTSSSLTCIHGIRFLSMTWVVLGHAFIFPITAGGMNTGPYLQEVIKRWSFQAILNATVSVDTFFVLSGLLVAYLSLKEMKKNSGKINWFMFFFHRFWRLTPAYMLVIMVYVCLSPYWGEGPFWPSANPDRDNCESSWWANLLYINNLANTDKQCLAQSWYLANDMQFYILSPLIFVPFYFSPIFGAVSSIIFLLITAIVPGALTMKDHFPPGLLPNTVQGNATNQMDFMNDFYIKPYNRMGPYVVGMLAGYFLYRTDCRLRISKIVNLSLWALATGCALALLYGLYDAYNGHPVTLPVSAFYNAINRQVWGACVAWVVIACVTGNGGFVNTILSWSALVPLSRLTYCIYLLHIMMMELYLLNLNTAFYMDDLNVVMFFLGILVVSYMAATVTSLAFETPFMVLEKVLFHPTPKDDKKEIEADQK
ncbi:nose resistant to fluoxetine protein 6-like isoform X2 [Littorina saxatilis]|uniref:Nose resistant-to-fluoxetine protein N-terminal domain-containing protein n=3 Tax=Littorina saxatilis TaxID=31220 RepID=A0AAN9AY33_9CAEN